MAASLPENTGKAILYAAKSTTDTKGSIPTQLADGRELAEGEGMEVIGEYADESASAFSGDRGPQLAAAKAEAERIAGEDGACSLIVQHSDRLARGDGANAAHLVEYALWAIKAGVKLRSIQDPQTFSDLLYTVVTGQRNHEDSKRKSQAVRDGARRKAERGERTGGPRPFGYRYGADGLEPHPAEAEIVRRIYAETIGGKSQLGIARDLEREGIPTVRGGRWQNCSVMAVLNNKIHCGFVKNHDEWWLGKHEPIIDEATWEKAQATREAKRKSTPGGRPPAGSHLFRKGMLRCGECGEALAARTNPNRSGKATETYRCLGRHRDKESCSMTPIRRELIDQAVYSYFEKVGLDVEATRRQLSEHRERRLAEVGALLSAAEDERSRAQAAVDRVKRDYKAGDLPASDYAELREETAEELQAAQNEADRLRLSLEEIEADEELADAERETLERLVEIRRAIAGEVKDAEGIEAVRAALVRLFDRFIIHPAGNVRIGRQSRDEPIPDGPNVRPVLDVDGYVIEVWIREQMLEGYGEAIRPILKREPLSSALASRGKGGESESRLNSIFGPIPVGVAQG